MPIFTSLLALALWAQIAYSEDNFPTFTNLLNRHCTYQCHKRLTETNNQETATDEAVNMTLVDELVREGIRKIKRRLQPSSCWDVDPKFAKLTKSNGDGIFNIHPLGFSVVEVFCDTTTDGGGWTVFQRRRNGDVDFYRDWNDYVSGFGDSFREFWLGLEVLHRMTKYGGYELRVDMIQMNGTRLYAGYRNFSIGSASDRYRLSVGGYYGNATDSLAEHNKHMFSTKNFDNDETDLASCAQSYKGGWWYTKCYDSNLNGVYGSRGHDGIRWWWKNFPKESMLMSFVEMKLRKKK